MIRKHYQTRLILVAIVLPVFLFIAVPAVAPGGAFSDLVRIEASVDAEIKIEYVQAENGEMFLAVARTPQGSLQGRDSIVALMDVPLAQRILSFSSIPRDRHWTWPNWPAHVDDVKEKSQFVLWEEGPGRYGAMMSVTGGGMVSYLSGAPGAIRAMATSHVEGYTPEQCPLFAAGWGEDPYQLTRDLYEFALSAMRDLDPTVIGKVRWEKDYPEIFDHVGWCSWNAYYQKVTAEDIIASAADFKAADFPLRWIIIDDGWQTLIETEKKPGKSRGYSMSEFDSNEKFPGGIESVIRTLKQDYGITWVGAWHTFNGYWNGIAVDSKIGRAQAESIMTTRPGVGIPDPRSEAGRAFWESWYDHLKAVGLDFVKVDDQSNMENFIQGQIPIGHAYAGAQANYQDVSTPRFGGNVLNCMSMNATTIYHWRDTNLARASLDFYPVPWHDPRRHAVNSVMNALWLSNLVYPDYDMWQTHDQFPAYHAVARAISGGPVYITDKPGRSRLEHLWPLILSDGRLIRVKQPGMPARKSLFVDPYKNLAPFMAFARTGDAGALAVWNVDRFERPVKAVIAPSDVEGIKGESFAVYGYFSGELITLALEEERDVRLKGWDVKLYSIVPITEGFAAIGLTNKYLSPATVLSVENNGDLVKVTLAEAGQFKAWCERAPREVHAEGAKIESRSFDPATGELMVKLISESGSSGPVTVEIEL
jgi:hypothetical protein